MDHLLPNARISPLREMREDGYTGVATWFSRAVVLRGKHCPAFPWRLDLAHTGALRYLSQMTHSTARIRSTNRALVWR